MLTPTTLPSQGGTPLFKLSDLNAVLDVAKVVEVTERALIDSANQRYARVPPVHLEFLGGDCHIKVGYRPRGRTYTVKVASGFYRNPEVGLPSGNGLVLLFDQTTGAPIAIFDDEGYLTAWRTAGATVAAVRAGALTERLRVAIVGTGTQATLAARWIPMFFDVEAIRLWSRGGRRSREISDSLAEVVPRPEIVDASLADLCGWANVIVTATSSREPVLLADWVAPGTHIVALGSDNPGKSEIEPRLVGRCDIVMTDDHDQCLHHGDFGNAVRVGCVDAGADIVLGVELETRRLVRQPRTISLVDLTGLGAQDDAIATLFMTLLGRV